MPTEVVMLKEKGVGRATLREALRILEVNGLITIKPGPGGGPIVAASSSRDFGRMATMHFQRAGLTFQDLLDARLTLEPMLARMAAERSNRADMSALKDVHQQSQDIDHNDDKAYATVTRQFHLVMGQLSGNPLLDFLTSTLADVYFDRFGRHLDESSDERRALLDMHEAIATAVLAGDGDVAERLTREHTQASSAAASARLPGLIHQTINWW
jgi:DNA-binding FadR family transcriptional regulator